MSKYATGPISTPARGGTTGQPRAARLLRNRVRCGTGSQPWLAVAWLAGPRQDRGLLHGAISNILGRKSNWALPRAATVCHYGVTGAGDGFSYCLFRNDPANRRSGWYRDLLNDSYSALCKSFVVSAIFSLGQCRARAPNRRENRPRERMAGDSAQADAQTRRRPASLLVMALAPVILCPEPRQGAVRLQVFTGDPPLYAAPLYLDYAQRLSRHCPSEAQCHLEPLRILR
jgi:hypothetical protein